MIKTSNDLRSWLKAARKGTRATYHRGYLAKDRVDNYFLGGRFVSNVVEPLNTLAWDVLLLASGGYLHLAQRRHGDFDYDYIMERTEKAL